MYRRMRPRPRRRERDLSQLPTLLTALTAVGALVFTGISVRATQRQLDIAETAQVTDRFTKAVDHLGDTRVDVRLGAVLALERIARDSTADRQSVGSLLAAFVRRSRPLRADCRDTFGPDHSDLAAALRVLARGLLTAPDLSLTCLSGVDLSHATLTCAALGGSYLQGTTRLAHADLSRADLSGARLDGVDPDDPAPVAANLTGARLVGAVLTFADLGHAHLRDADLTGADLTGADLREVDLTGAVLTGARVHEAVFSDERVRQDVLARGAVDDTDGAPPPDCGG
ncbi:pentapeptide repeat-containing protein [Actinosynnema sp. NPDC020468]|uniref:pentapeptide repeat-containing protein n=1 Tax=Actinosynnema sp. NPDC020468 TaxID=3154488 RepID=UPI0033F1C0EE